LEILAKKPDNQKFIICDVFFEAPAPPDPCYGDSLSPDVRLGSALAKLPNILIPYHYEDNAKKMAYPIFQAPQALANYLTVDGQFFKYEYISQDSVKSLPVRMYEYLHNKQMSQAYGLDWIDGKPLFNAFILDFPIRQYDLFHAKERYKVDNLENMLSGFMSEADILEYCKGRMVVIGDFEVADKHETVYGDMGGTLILVNAYLALANGDALLSWGFILFIFTAYFLSSYYLFWHALLRESEIKSPIRKIWWQLFSNVLLLAIISVLSYFIFSVHLSILYLSLYLEVVKFALDKFLRRFSSSIM
jgi:hypothetical protein